MIINQFRSFKLISRQLLLNVKLHCWFFKSHFKTKEADLNRSGDFYITWCCRIICFGQRSATKALDKMSLPELLIVEMKTLSKPRLQIRIFSISAFLQQSMSSRKIIEGDMVCVAERHILYHVLLLLILILMSNLDTKYSWEDKTWSGGSSTK